MSAAACGALLAAGLVAYVMHNIGNRYFWTDESSTFLNALGWPVPGETLGSWSEMWLGATRTFLDPGLFHVLARAWILGFGPSIEALRVLPLLLFLAYLVGIALLGRHFRLPWALALAVVGAMLLENITPYYGVEFRPYSGGQAASVIIPLLALALVRRPSWRWWALYVLAFVFLSSMQFNSAPIAVGATALLLATQVVPALRDRLGIAAGRARAVIVSAAAVTLTWLPLVYLTTRGSPFKDPQADVIYMDSTILRYMPWEEALADLQANLLSFTALPRTAFLVAVPVALAMRWLTLPDRGCRGDSRLALVLLWLFVLVSTLASAAAALLGFLPWVVGSRWSITEIGLIACSLVGLLALGRELVPAPPRRAGIAAAVLSVIVAAAGAWRIGTYERPYDVDYLTTLAPVILEGAPGRTMVDYWLSTDVRYWMEFSPEQAALRDAWVAHGIKETGDYDPADAEDLRRFLTGSDDRFLMRSQAALEDSGVALPDSVTVVTVDPARLDGVDPRDVPVLLVKSPA